MKPVLRDMAEYAEGTSLMIYEKVRPNMVEKIKFTSGTLAKEMDELMDGDILIIQRESQMYENHKLPTPKEYSRQFSSLKML